MLQHIQHAVPGLGQGVVIPAPGEIGEHAGHGDSRGRTAGAHVLEGYDSRFLLGETVGLLAIAVEGVILATRRLPHHQEHQGRLVPLPHHPGVRPQRLIRNGGGKQYISGIAIEAVYIVGWHYLLAKRLVVAPDRGVILIIERSHPHQKQQ